MNKQEWVAASEPICRDCEAHDDDTFTCDPSRSRCPYNEGPLVRRVRALAEELDRLAGSALDDARVKHDPILLGIAMARQSDAAHLRRALDGDQ